MILLFVPAFFLLLYGYALNFDIRQSRSPWRTRSLAPRAGALVSAFVKSGYFDLVADRRRADAREIARPDGPRRVACGAGDPGTDSRGRCAGESRRCRCSSTATTRTPPPPSWAMSGRSSATSRRGTRRRAGRGAARRRRRRAARLVQPAAAQHALPGARPDRLHRDDRRGRLDGAFDRAREGARHDGAGPDGADRHRCRSSSARRCRTSSSRSPRRWRSCSRRWCCSICRCAGSWLLLLLALSLFLIGALGTRAAHLDASPTPSRWRSSWRCSRRFCRR